MQDNGGMMDQDRGRAVTIGTGRIAGMLCLLILAVILIYGQVRDFEFINFNDGKYVYENGAVMSGLNREAVSWAFSIESSRDTDLYFHPLTWLSHMADCQLFGLNAGAHHLVSVWFHCLNTLLLFGVLWKMTRAFWRSLFVASLFALHPLSVESVVWISERKNLLSTFFMLLCIGSYWLYAKKPGILRYGAVFILFLLGMLSKPMIVTVPFLFVLMDIWPLQRYRTPENKTGTNEGKGDQAWKKGITFLVIEKLPFIAFITIYVPFVYLSLQVSDQVVSQDARPMALRLAHALVSYLLYLGKMLYPVNLSIFHPYPASVSLWQVGGALGIVFFVTLLSQVWLKKRPYVLFGWFWYLISLTPVLGIIQGGYWPSYAGRWSYVPLIGIYVIIAWGMKDIFDAVKPSRLFQGAVPVIIISFLGLLTWIQAGYWKNSLSLFMHSNEVTKSNYLVQTNLAHEYEKLHMIGIAEKYYLEVVRERPEDGILRGNLAKFYANNGQYEKAMEQFSLALRSAPGSKVLFLNLGSAQARYGELDKAIDSYRKALKLDSRFTVAYLNLGRAYLEQRRIPEAIDQLEKATSLQPSLADVYVSLGYAYVLQREYDKAEMQYRKLLALDPDSQLARVNLNAILQEKGKKRELNQP